MNRLIVVLAALALLVVIIGFGADVAQGAGSAGDNPYQTDNPTLVLIGNYGAILGSYLGMLVALLALIMGLVRQQWAWVAVLLIAGVVAWFLPGLIYPGGMQNPPLTYFLTFSVCAALPSLAALVYGLRGEPKPKA
jgi:hypothetical protein